MPARHQLKGAHGRTARAVEQTKKDLLGLEPEYPTLAAAIKALVPTIDSAIENGHHVNKVYELVAKRLDTSPHTVKSVIQRAKREQR
jgi:DNA-directed RNA polymerase specialized sigma24 family protein